VTAAATYDEAVRDFDHSALAVLPAYARLRQALSDPPTAASCSLVSWYTP
jgi:hypothetical protein